MAARRPRRDSLNLAPLLGFLVVAAVGIGIAGWVFRSKGSAAAEQEASALGSTDTAGSIVDPFADIPDEEPPERGRGATSMRLTDKAPVGLTSIRLWVEAQAVAAEGFALAAEAEAAKKAEDGVIYNAKGRAAREAFDKALEDTALWEEELLELYGENDRQVRSIKRERSRWFEKMARYRKAGMDAVGGGG